MITKQEARENALKFLDNNPVGVIATSDSSGQPFASAVYYAVKNDFTIYFLTSHSTHKHSNIVQNNKVGFTVGIGPQYTSVELRGQAVIVSGAELDEASSLLVKVQLRVPMVKWPLERIEALKKGGLELYKIIPEQATYMNLDSDEQIDSLSNFVYQIVP